jgi:peroxiredoxin
MRKLYFALLACFLFSGVMQAQQEPKIKVGDVAPDFTLIDQNGKPHSLHDYKGKNVALAFYVWAFSPNCTQEMQRFQQNLKKMETADTQVLGVSIDSPFANKAFADQNGVAFPLLSDMDAKVIREYGLYKEYDKFNTKLPAARRATYLIDKNGKVVEMQVDQEAADPTKTVVACERRKGKV